MCLFLGEARPHMCLMRELKKAGFTEVLSSHIQKVLAQLRSPVRARYNYILPKSLHKAHSNGTNSIYIIKCQSLVAAKDWSEDYIRFRLIGFSRRGA